MLLCSQLYDLERDQCQVEGVESYVFIYIARVYFVYIFSLKTFLVLNM